MAKDLVRDRTPPRDAAVIDRPFSPTRAESPARDIIRPCPEAAKWEAKLQAVKEDGRRRVEEVRARGRERLDRIRQDMAKSFEESFRPLLHDAEERHRREMESVQKLRTELQAREEELRRAEKRAEDAAGASPTRTGRGS